jgi:ppGpp synthetase/RelA/SpoT-type nucleotidyltranferase
MSVKSIKTRENKASGQLVEKPRRRRGRCFASNVAVPEIWREQPDLIIDFLSRQPDHEQLCLEIAYVMKTRLKKTEIEYSSITYRAKELNSFLEKLGRKKYKDPFKEITDLAGVRVVCLYRSDLPAIEEIVRREFKLVEKVDKGRDSFGYNAVHYLVKLGQEFSGARYDHLKDIICEVQVRTILQHAWATIDEHMVYKKKSSIPGEMSQRINQLSLVLEDADRQFEEIRNERTQYIKRLQMTRGQEDFRGQEINPDSFKIFVERYFPTAERDDRESYTRVIKWLDAGQYKTIGDLQDVLEKAAPLLKPVTERLEEMLRERGSPNQPWTDLELFHVSMAICDRDYRGRVGISQGFASILEEFDKPCR